MQSLACRGKRVGDHPREYGENEQGATVKEVGAGPSPRIRGELWVDSLIRSMTGTIPANTGRMPGTSLCQIRPPGPSPRIRGEYHVGLVCPRSGRTIPANTGRMKTCPLRLSQLGDHPREYGENRLSRGGIVSGLGPSPRIRGEFLCVGRGADGVGTIPANTGRMNTGSWLSMMERDHPREYGENCICGSAWMTWCGPSPRIRGESQISKREVTFKGTIPANTGRIRCRCRAGRRMPDHPREYGENSIFPSTAQA